MTFKLLLAAAIVATASLVAPAQAQEFEYKMPSSNLKLVVIVPDGWKKTKDVPAVGELVPHSVEFKPATPSGKDEDSIIAIDIFPATPETKAFPDDAAKGMAAQALQISIHDCNALAFKPNLGAGDLNGFPIALSYSACWLKTDLVKKYPKTKKGFSASSYLVSTYKRSLFTVARDFSSNDVKTRMEDLSEAELAALKVKSFDATNFTMENVLLCDTDKTKDACAKISAPK